MKKPPKRICWFYQCWQPAFEEMKRGLGKRIVFHEGMPDKKKLETIIDRSPRPLVCCFDDLQQELGPDIVNLFTVWSHHKAVSVILLMQNFFGKKAQRDISLSATHLVLFKSPRCKQTAMNLGKQLFPGRAGEFMRLYEAATRDAFSHLMINVMQECAESLRLTSHILPEQHPMRCYMLEQ